MSQTLLFEIGAVIFLAVVTALFLYGLAEFKDWQDRDDHRADTVRDTDQTVPVTAGPVLDDTAGQVVPLDRSTTDASGQGPRSPSRERNVVRQGYAIRSTDSAVRSACCSMLRASGRKMNRWKGATAYQ
jgi:hypothetical protein